MFCIFGHSICICQLQLRISTKLRSSEQQEPLDNQVRVGICCFRAVETELLASPPLPSPSASLRFSTLAPELPSRCRSSRCSAHTFTDGNMSENNIHSLSLRRNTHSICHSVQTIKSGFFLSSSAVATAIRKVAGLTPDSWSCICSIRTYRNVCVIAPEEQTGGGLDVCVRRDERGFAREETFSGQGRPQ